MDAVVPGAQLHQFPAFMEHFSCCRVFSLIISLADFLIFPSTYLCCIMHLSYCFHGFLLPFCSHDAISVVDLHGGDM